jgi:hypothetical protein
LSVIDFRIPDITMQTWPLNKNLYCLIWRLKYCFSLRNWVISLMVIGYLALLFLSQKLDTVTYLRYRVCKDPNKSMCFCWSFVCCTTTHMSLLVSVHVQCTSLTSLNILGPSPYVMIYLLSKYVASNLELNNTDIVTQVLYQWKRICKSNIQLS